MSLASISDGVKAAYAAASGADLGRLLGDRAHKESHRAALSSFYAAARSSDPGFDARCFVAAVQRGAAGGGVLALTGMRDGLGYAALLAGRPLFAVHVTASDDAKSARGWAFDPRVDASPGECAAEAAPPSFFDLTFRNDSHVCEGHAAAWVAGALAPAVLRSAIRSLSKGGDDGARPWVFRDVLSITAQPWGLRLCTSLLAAASQPMRPFDVILSPEASGWVFSSPLASRLAAPLALARRPGHAAGPVVAASYAKSNVAALSRRLEGSSGGADAARSVSGGDMTEPPPRSDDAVLEVDVGSVRPGARVLIVDDTLASGRTACALASLVACCGGTVASVLCVMELPEVGGRASVAAVTPAPVAALVCFDGV